MARRIGRALIFFPIVLSISLSALHAAGNDSPGGDPSQSQTGGKAAGRLEAEGDASLANQVNYGNPSMAGGQGGGNSEEIQSSQIKSMLPSALISPAFFLVSISGKKYSA